MNSTIKKKTTPARKKSANVPIVVDNGLTMMVPIGDVINSTYSQVAVLKTEQNSMSTQLLQNALELKDINKSIRAIDTNIQKYNENMETKFKEHTLKHDSDIQSVNNKIEEEIAAAEKKHNSEMTEIKINMPKKMSSWFKEKAQTADAISKVSKIALILFIVVWTVVAGIPGLLDVLKLIGVNK